MERQTGVGTFIAGVLGLVFLYFMAEIGTNVGRFGNLAPILRIDSESDPRNISDTPEGKTLNSSALRKCKREERTNYVKQQCELHMGGFFYDKLLSMQTSQDERRNIYKRLIVDDNHKLVLCFPAKIGCSTFKSLLIQYSEKYLSGEDRPGHLAVHSGNFLRRFNLTHLIDYEDEAALRRIKEYSKIMIVRNPLVRVFSAYREKLAHIKPPACQPYQRSLGRKVLQESRGVLTPDEEKCGYNATFPEFMSYFAHHLSLTSDPHWRQFAKTCHACDLKYDHILRLETGHSDELEFINKYLKSGNIETTSVYLRNNQSSLNETNVAANNFEQVYPQFAGVSRSDFEIIKETYKTELLLYGYSAELTNQGLISKCSINKDACC